MNCSILNNNCNATFFYNINNINLVVFIIVITRLRTASKRSLRNVALNHTLHNLVDQITDAVA